MLWMFYERKFTVITNLPTKNKRKIDFLAGNVCKLILRHCVGFLCGFDWFFCQIFMWNFLHVSILVCLTAKWCLILTKNKIFFCAKKFVSYFLELIRFFLKFCVNFKWNIGSLRLFYEHFYNNKLFFA
jgi:hypothetical protein